jgi:predicted nucleic acid-binding protein
MAELKIKGWDTGRNKVTMMELLQESLGMDEKQTEELAEAIHAGKVISLNFEDAEFAADLAEKLTGVGATVSLDEE